MNFLCLFQPFGHVVKCLWSSREDFLVYFLQQMLFFHPFSTLLSSSQMRARFLGKSSFHFCVFFPPSSSSFFLLFASNVCSSFFYLLCVYIFEGIFFPGGKMRSFSRICSICDYWMPILYPVRNSHFMNIE